MSLNKSAQSDMPWLHRTNTLPLQQTNSLQRSKMSYPCAVSNCKRTSRALCHCCTQNLCRDHLNEHDERLNSQLNPFADELNQLNERLNHLNAQVLVEDAFKQLNQWRERSHQLVEEYFSKKQRKLNEYAALKIHRQLNQINQLKTILNELIRNQDTTSEDLTSISLTLHSLRREIAEIEYKSFQLNINPIQIDDTLIEIDEDGFTEDFDLSTLTPPSQTINRPSESSKPLATNNRVLLMHHDNRLCLLSKDLTISKYTNWTHGWIWDMCWSSALSRFVIITLTEMFLLDETNMALERIATKERFSFCSCTCSEKSLYVTTNEVESSICEFSLQPVIAIVNRWQPADLCRANEMIQDMVFHRGTFGIIIENQASHRKRMELRIPDTFELLWTVQFDTVDPLHNSYRLCSFNCHEWIVIDWKSSQLLHITKDGQIKSTCVYSAVPYRCCQFGSDLLAISTRNGVTFHTM